MKVKWPWFIAILSLTLWVGSLAADSVYFWTDENGIRHYSNTGIPSDIQEAGERPEEISPEVSAPPPAADDTARREDDIPETPEGAPEEESAEAGGGQEIDGRLAARIEEERQRLQSEIKRIEGLAIGVSFTQGMKDARIRPLKEQLALLDADPKRYFRMKREGAFGDAGTPEPEAGPTASPDQLSGSLEPLSPVSSAGPDGGGENSDEENSPSEQE